MNALTELDQSLFELLMSFILFHSFIDPPDSSVDCIYLYNCLTIKHYMHLTEGKGALARKMKILFTPMWGQVKSFYPQNILGVIQ